MGPDLHLGGLVKRPLGHAVILCAILFFGCARTGVSVRQTADGLQGIDSAASRELEAVLQQYVRAVNDADRDLLREIWDPGDGASYINPTQRLWTWDDLAGSGRASSEIASRPASSSLIV